MFLKSIIVCIAILFSISAEAAEQHRSLEVGDVIRLQKPYTEGNISIEEAIQGRRSIRDFADIPLRPRHLSQILWAAGGATVDGITGPTRAYPSAGGIYPLEIYLVAGNVMMLEPGIYRYNWKNHSLVLLKKGDFRTVLTKAAMGQKVIQDAPATIVVTAFYDKTMRKYGQRGATRYIPLDAGHLSQNVYLVGQTMGLGTVILGAFNDHEVAKVIGVKGEIPLCIMPIGHPAE